MITGDFEMLDQVAKSHVCPEHPDKALEVAWTSTYGYIIRCGAAHYPDEVTELKGPYQQYQEGTLPDGPIKDNIERKGRQEAMTEHSPAIDNALLPRPVTDLGSGALLSPEAVKALTLYALKYGLDPFRGHVVLYHGAPYIGLDGYLYHANKLGKPFSLNSFPVLYEDRPNYFLEPGDHAWIAEVTMIETGAKFNGLGIVTKAEIDEPSKNNPNIHKSPVVAKHPWQLTQKRAEWQAMRRAFPIGEDPREGEAEK